MKKILQIGADVLRQKAKEVLLSDIRGSEINKVLKEMKEALGKEEDGVAIAAPQIGYSKRIFIVSPRVFEEKDQDKQQIYINPKIIKLSKDKTFLDEGCLSVRWKYGEVERSNKATIEAYDQKGEKFQRGAGGLLAQIFQHEVDHLDGILFIDKAENLSEYTPDNTDSKNTQ